MSDRADRFVDFQPPKIQPPKIRGAFRDVLAFHRKFGQVIHATPMVPDPDCVALRIRLIREECDELCAAMARGDLPEVADGAIDSIYVILGGLVAHGIDPEPIWSAVQESNMSKIGCGKDDFGKVMKPPGFKPPDIGAILAKQEPIPVFEDSRFVPSDPMTLEDFRS